MAGPFLSVQINQLPPANTLVGNEICMVMQGGRSVQTTVGAIMTGVTTAPEYLLLAGSGFLPNSRTFTVSGTGLTLTDAGAGSTLTLGIGASLSALQNLVGTGLISQNAPNSLILRTLAGVTNQTVATNVDGVAGNPTIGLASNPVIPGNGGISIPAGTTFQRPIAAAGTLRYNSSLGNLEYYNGINWVLLTQQISGGGVRIITAAGAVTMVNNDVIVEIAQSLPAACLVNIPTNPIVAQIYTVKDGRGIAKQYPITLQPPVGLIDGALNYIISNAYGAASFYWNGSAWRIVSKV